MRDRWPARRKARGRCRRRGGQRDRFTQGHRGRTPVPAWHLAELAGAGGLRSTATDLLAFARAQLEGGTGELADAIRLSHDAEHQLTRDTWIHLGWLDLRLPPSLGAHTVLWHSGGTGGYSTWIGIVPAERVAVVVLSNTSRSVDRAALELLNAILADESR